MHRFHAGFQQLKRPLDIISLILRRANEHHIYLAAAGIAFNVMLLILPTLLVAVFVIGMFVDQHSAIAAMKMFLQQSFPLGEQLQGIVPAVEHELQEALRQYQQAGWIGIPILLWISLALFTSIRTALSAVFGLQERDSFVQSAIKDLIMLGVFVVALLSVNLTPALLLHVERWIGIWAETTSLIEASRFVVGITPFVVAKTFMFIFFVLLYRYAPHQPPPTKIVLTSAALYLVLWEALQTGFALYLERLATYNILYGIYANAAAAAFWLYYMALALLLSAECARALFARTARVRAGNYVIG